MKRRRTLGPLAAAETGLSGTRWWILAAVCLQIFVSLAFKSMAPVALGDVQRALGADLAQLQWVVDSYTLVLAALALAGGALADFVGRRQLFFVGLTLFFLGALAAALAPSATALDLATGVFGLGAGLSFAPGIALMNEAFRGHERGIAFGALGATSGAASAFGTIAGGELVERFGWRSIFAACAAFALAAVLIASARIGFSGEATKRRLGFDWLGLCALTATIFSLNFALIHSGGVDFTSPAALAAFTTAALSVAMLALRRGRVACGAAPVVPPSLVRRRAVAGVSLVGLTSSFVVFGLAFYMALYLEGVLAERPLAAGERLLPLGAIGLIAGPLGGRLMRVVSMGTLMAVCLLLVALGALLLHGLDSSSDWTQLLPGFVVVGVGIGALTPPMLATAADAVPPASAGLSLGLNNTVRQLGVGFGVAGLGALLQAHLSSRLLAVPGGHARALATAVASGDLHAPAGLSPAARRIFASVAPNAFYSGLNELFVVLACVALIGAAASLLLVRSRDLVGSPLERAFEPRQEASLAASEASR